MKYCTKCGTQMPDDTIVCPQCQQPTNSNFSASPQQPSQPKSKKIIIIAIAAILCAVLITIICLKTIPYKSFNIKDDELIEILNDCGAYTSNSPVQVDNINPNTTIYRLTYASESGLLVLSHSFSGHIRCIMVCFEDNDVYAAAIITAIASELDPSFTNDAMMSLLWYDKPYSSNEYTAILEELSTDLTGVFLAPNEHVEYCVDSIFDN